MISYGALVFGNMEGWQMLRGLNTARARLGIRRLLATLSDLAPVAGLSAFFPFMILIVIFGLPAVIGDLGKTLSSLLAILGKVK
jgi:hypothetical protein